jgi:tRNA1(Val) A37 N6-methylase TrmN6
MKSSKCLPEDLHPDEALDLFMDGRLKVIQSRRGYRFSIDAVLLSQFVTIRSGDRVLDLGTGCGIVLLLLLLTRPVGRAVGLDIQAQLASQAERNARINGFETRMDVVIGDIRNPPLAEMTADVVVCNPPYRRAHSGRINPDHQKAVARHEILASSDDLLKAAATLMKKRGTLAMIYPAERLVDILVRMRRFNVEPKRIQIHYPDTASNAKLALIEGVKGGRPGLEIVPPVLGQGEFSI